MEGILIGQGKAEETTTGQKLEEPEDYDTDEQVVGGVDSEKQQQNKQAENIGMCVYTVQYVLVCVVIGCFWDEFHS